MPSMVHSVTLTLHSCPYWKMPILKLSKIDTYSREVTLPFSFVCPFAMGATLSEMYSIIQNSKNLLP